MEKTGLSLQAYNDIKQLIVNGEIKAGQRITEVELQKRLNIGRTPIRDALHELARDKLVVIRPRFGVQVSTITPKKIREIFEVRKMIEPAALYEYMDKLDTEWLKGIREDFNVIIDKNSPNLEEEIRSQAEIDNKFHRTITDLCDNEYINSLYDSMFAYINIMRIEVSHNVERFNESNKEHIDIIDYIFDGDKDEARKILAEHLDKSYKQAIFDMCGLA